jgi:exosortase C (VPDSG-CTERM-specific)
MHQYRRFFLYVALLTACFILPLAHWIGFALNSGLFSYVLLIPFISGYLIWLRRKSPSVEKGSAWMPAALCAAGGMGSLGAGIMGSAENALACQILAYCFMLWCGGFAFLGLEAMRSMAFPALFLIFMVPIPPFLMDLLEAGLQHASAEVAYRFIYWAGIPIHRSGLDFQMPRIAISVAPQCSGIRSSLVLFITSLVAGNLYCRSAWARTVLSLCVIPLGIVRNAFRILVLSYLCVRVDPSYIHSPIHKQGGPLFFALSLIPFGILLYLLRKK